MQNVSLSRESIIRLATAIVKHKFYGDNEVSNAVKLQPLYQDRLKRSILDVVELIKLNNACCEA